MKLQKWALFALAVSLITQAASRTALAQNPEHRALWAYAWGPGIKSPTEVSALVARALSANCNVIAAQVRKVGDAYYTPTRPNCDIRAVDIPEGYDPLQELLNQAHGVGLKVYAWVVVNRIATIPPSDPCHIYNRHPNWLCMSNAGQTSFDEGYFVDPGVPDAAEWNYNVCMDLIKHYDLDGLFLDFIRYPQQNSGYNPIALQRFRERYGLAPTYIPAPNDSLFSAWRREQVTFFVRKLYANMLSVKPNMVLSASTFSDRNDAYNYRFQDWRTWMMSGFLDANCPMVYTSSNSIFNNRVDDAVANSGGRHVYILQGSYKNTIANSMTQLLSARSRGSHGQGIYRYCYTYSGDVDFNADDEPDFYSALTSQVYTTPTTLPPMSWKTSPSVGHVMGRILDANQGKGVDAAWVMIEPIGLGTYTDGTGFYAHLNLASGTYTISVTKTGYTQQVKQVTITAGEIKTVDFTLAGSEVSGISAAKLKSDGSGVVLPPMVVTAGTNQLKEKFYIEDQEQLSGILVKLPPNSDLEVHPGDIVRVCGPMSTSDSGERQIINPLVIIESTGHSVPDPIAIAQSDLGGQALGMYTMGVVGGRGVNNIGLLVQTVGKITAVDPTNNCFYIDDGSALEDGSGSIGVRVLYDGLADGNIIVPPQQNAYVRVTGLSSTVKLSGNIYRAIRLRDQADWVSETCPVVTSPEELITPGWNLISIPYTPKNPSPPSIFGSMPIDGRLWEWDPETQSFRAYDSWSPQDFGNIQRGEGYWLNASDSGCLEFEAFENIGADFLIGVPKASWAIIGCPFQTSQPWAELLVTNGIETVPIKVGAEEKGWIDGTGWWWDNSSQSLLTASFPENFPASESLDPWRGYWIRSNVDKLALIVQHN
ncbi:MAG: family 10 glycosylhydrolase [Armatimonadota bacterium]|nr:family 10 glycosylhydrolase [Armatimonadota bacterium]